MRRIYFLSFIFILFSFGASAQPFALSMNNVDGSPYTCTLLEDLGSYKRLRFQATQTSAAATWELPQTCAFPGNVWRPYTEADATPLPFNIVIPPTPNTYAALWNSNNGGVPGKLSPVTNGNYYTFNVENITCNSGVCNSPHIGVLETSYFPVSFPTVTQSPLADAVGSSIPVTATVTSSAVPIENVFLRYTTNDYLNTTVVPVLFTGTTGTAVIPGFPVGTIVKYYIYSSNKSQALIESEVSQYGEIVHDMSTLDWNVNTGNNYPYIVLDITPITIQYLKGFKQTNCNELTWKLQCSNISNIHLSLERSNDGRNFSAIHSVNTDPVRCEQAFNYKDYGFRSGLNYYRLNIQNPDGRINYSTVVALLNAANTFEITSLTPTLVDNDNFNLEITSTKTMKLNLKLLDMSGRKIRNINTSIVPGTNQFKMDVSSLASGMYCVAAQSQDGVVRTMKFFKK